MPRPTRRDPRFAIDSRWTSLVPQSGWVHFRVVDRRWTGDKRLEVELMAVADRSVRFWIDAAALLDRNRFRSGWRDPSLILGEGLTDSVVR